jgi:hypothetical protein
VRQPRCRWITIKPKIIVLQSNPVDVVARAEKPAIQHFNDYEISLVAVLCPYFVLVEYGFVACFLKQVIPRHPVVVVLVDLFTMKIVYQIKVALSRKLLAEFSAEFPLNFSISTWWG